MPQYGFSFDSSGCSGCKACVMACKDKHHLAIGQNWRRVYEVTGGSWQQQGAAWVPQVFAYNLSIACNHCQEPICAEVCPAEAIQKRPDGIVLIEAGRCVGCGYCSWACPYGALQMDESRGTMTKCTLCADRLDMGESPACVAACPLRVLDVIDLEAVPQITRPPHPIPLPAEHYTQPVLQVHPHPASAMVKAPSRPQKRTFWNWRRKPAPEPIVPAQVLPGQPGIHGAGPLAFFTLVMQAAFGLFVFWLGLAPGIPADQVDGFTRLALGASAWAAFTALLASLGHLGRPLQAWRAIRNLKTSWLSREVLFAAAFTGLALLAWAIQFWYGTQALLSPLGLALGAAVVLAGAGMVFSMGRLYMLRTVPVWNSPTTLISFFTTGLLLGGLGAALILSINLGGFDPDLSEQVEAISHLTPAVILAAAAHIGVLRGVRRAAKLGRRGKSWNFYRTNYQRGLAAVASIAAVCAVIFLPTPTLTTAMAPAPVVNNILLSSAFLLTLAAEMLGRMWFYRLYRRVGV